MFGDVPDLNATKANTTVDAKNRSKWEENEAFKLLLTSLGGSVDYYYYFSSCFHSPTELLTSPPLVYIGAAAMLELAILLHKKKLRIVFV